MQQRLLHTFPLNKGRDHGAGVIDAVRDHGPAIVVSRLDNIYLITAAGAVFMGNQDVFDGIKHQPLNVPVPVTVYFRQSAFPANEGVVGGNTAIRVQPHDLAQMTGQVLRLLPIVKSVSQRHDQRTIRKPGHSATVVGAAFLGRLGAEYLDNLRQGLRLQLTTGHAQVIRRGRPASVGEKDQLVILKVRRQQHTEQTCLSIIENRRNSGNRRLAELPLL